MLKSHMNAVEEQLIATSKIPANSGHSLHKGTPREAFIKEFLQKHLPKNVSIGTGEIIDSQSKPGKQRNQFDIVIYKNNYPKLDFGGGINGFLVESVIATIEVKSTLTKKGLENSIRAAKNSKALKINVVHHIPGGYIPPAILNYVIAYAGPKKIKTTYKWIKLVHDSLKISCPSLSTNEKLRMSTPSSSIDGVFVLQKGFIYFDNVPTGFINNSLRKEHPNYKWVLSNCNNGNLLLLFLFLQRATENTQGQLLNISSYLKSSQSQHIAFD